VRLADYDHFLRIASGPRWEERELDLSRDAEVWPGVDERRRATISTLLAGFCLGEAAVADELEPFALGAGIPERSACFRAQAADEARHARLFDRVAKEIVGVPGRSAQERRAALRPLLRAEFHELFDERLPRAARCFADAEGLGEAVALYHMVLEGLVFTAGQFAMRELLEDIELPGLRRGLELVMADERWHLGFGARVLQDVGISRTAMEHLLGEGNSALEAWGDAIDEQLAERMLVLHRRRLRAAGLAPPAVLA
jgi:ribonucleoside-diphosphate reductase beta chain